MLGLHKRACSMGHSLDKKTMPSSNIERESDAALLNKRGLKTDQISAGFGDATSRVSRGTGLPSSIITGTNSWSVEGGDLEMPCREHGESLGRENDSVKNGCSPGSPRT